jgi:hypothetical protein
MRDGCVRMGFCVGVAASALACSPPELVEAGSPTLVNDPQPVVAVRNGAALAAWHRGSPRHVHVSNYVSGTGWTTTSDIATGEFPQVALSSTGRGFAVYRRSTGVYARVEDSGRWRAEQLLSTTSGGVRVAAAASDAGTGIAAWANGSVGARVYNGTSWAPAVTLGTGGQAVAVAMNAAGVGAAAWCSSDHRIYATRYIPAVGWERPSASSPSCCEDQFGLAGRAFHVAITDAGDVVVAGGGGRICARRYISGTGWTGTTLLASIGYDVALGVNASGTAVVAWRDGGNTLLARLGFWDGLWGDAVTLDDNVHNGPLGAGMGSTGYGAVSYPRGTGSADIYYDLYNPTTGVWGTPGSMESLAGASYYPSVGYDPNVEGSGATIWVQSGPSSVGEEIRASTIGL